MRRTLKELREESGFSQEAIARRLGRSSFCYINWEKGKTKIPVEVVKPLAKVFKKTEEEVYHALANTKDREVKNANSN